MVSSISFRNSPGMTCVFSHIACILSEMKGGSELPGLHY